MVSLRQRGFLLVYTDPYFTWKIKAAFHPEKNTAKQRRIYSRNGTMKCDQWVRRAAALSCSFLPFLLFGSSHVQRSYIDDVWYSGRHVALRPTRRLTSVILVVVVIVSWEKSIVYIGNKPRLCRLFLPLQLHCSTYDDVGLSMRYLHSRVSTTNWQHSSQSPTAHLPAPLENISKPTYFHCHSTARNSSY